MFLTDKQIGERYGVNRTTVWRWRQSDPDFPQPVTLSPGCVRWRLADLEKWEARKTAGTQPEGAAA